MENRASQNTVPDSLLQTVGIMTHMLRSIRYMEKRMSDVTESTDLDPCLFSEMQHLRDATSEVMFRLSHMGIVVTDLLKDAEKGQSSGPKPLCGAKRDQGPARKRRNRLEIDQAAVR